VRWQHTNKIIFHTTRSKAGKTFLFPISNNMCIIGIIYLYIKKAMENIKRTCFDVHDVLDSKL
jgi:hypothetical protein